MAISIPLSNSRISLYVHSILRLVSLGASAVVATLFCYFVWEQRHHPCRARPLEAWCRTHPETTKVSGVYAGLILASVFAIVNAVLGTVMLIHATLSTDRIHGAPPPVHRLFAIDAAALLSYIISFAIYTNREHVSDCSVTFPQDGMQESVPHHFCSLSRVGWAAVVIAMGLTALCTGVLGTQIVAERGHWWKPTAVGRPSVCEPQMESV